MPRTLDVLEFYIQVFLFFGESRELQCHGRAAVVIERVSANSLCQTGIFQEMAGDFPPFRPGDWENGSTETKPNTRKARISGPVRRGL